MKIKYSPDAREQLKQIKRIAGDRSTGKILKAINRLADNPWMCPTIEKMFGIRLRTQESRDYWGE